MLSVSSIHNHLILGSAIYSGNFNEICGRLFDIRITHLDNIVVESSTSLFKQIKLQLRRRYYNQIANHNTYFSLRNFESKRNKTFACSVIRVRIAALSMNVS